VIVENSPGIYNPNKIKILPDLVDPLKKAGEIASQEGYLIKVLAGWRSLTTQIKLVCGAISSGREDKLGPFIGWPGGNSTGHGGGRAIDMELWKDGARLVPCCSSDQQKDPQWIPGSQKLVEIMTKAGWRRLSTEIWHFEYGSNASCRCDANSSCPPSGGHC
jgi:D-alanyl-D-alanine dipeptidase